MPQFKVGFVNYFFDKNEFRKAQQKALRDIIHEGMRKFVQAALAKIPFRTGFVRGAFSDLNQFLGLGARSSVTTPLTRKIRTRIAKKEKKTIERIRQKKKIPKGSARLKKLKAQIRAKISKKLTFKRIQKRILKLERAKRILKHIGRRIERKHPKLTAKAAKIVRRRKGKEVTRGDISFRQEYYYPPGKGRAGRILKTLRSGLQFATPIEDIFDVSILESRMTININFAVNISYYELNDILAGHAPTAPWRSIEAGRKAFINYIKSDIARKKFPDIRNFIETKTR